MAILTVTSAFFAFGQSISPEFNPPAPVITAPQQGQTDTITTLFPVRPLIPQTYDELMQQELAQTWTCHQTFRLPLNLILNWDAM